MPKWGLSQQMRDTRPWNLDPDLLAPSKIITDPIHGDIHLTLLEKMIVDSPPLQRLRRVRQLGTTHLVYPGATHNRFSHSLGSLRSAQDLLDAVIDQVNSYNPEFDLFQEWRKKRDEVRDKAIAEATVLARVGALLHDLCHVPFGHSLEDELGLLKAHDANVERFDMLWSQFDGNLLQILDSGNLGTALRPLILSKEHEDLPNDYKYPFVADIVGNTICADLLDYLPRDHRYTGLPASLGVRFVSSFYVTPTTHKNYAMRMVARISKKGRERADVVSELLKYLRYRYELSERALFHHTKLAADTMVGKALEVWYDDLWIEEAKKHCRVHDQTGVDIDTVRGDIAKVSPTAITEIDQTAVSQVEKTILLHSDDGLLENLSAWSAEDFTNRRRKAVHVLVNGILNRRLFRLVARCSNRSQSKALYRKFGSPIARRQAEISAATYGSIQDQWKLLLWLPDPTMKLKAAEVLVNDGRCICPLKEWDTAGRKRGAEIYESHEALWSLCIFADRSLSDEELEPALGALAVHISVSWDNDPKSNDDSALYRMAVERVGRSYGLSRVQEEELLNSRAAAFGADGSGTFVGLVQHFTAVAEQKFRRDPTIIEQPPVVEPSVEPINPAQTTLDLRDR